MNTSTAMEGGERERLSREMNHRLQNNVQWLAMLLEFQPAQVPAEAARFLNGVASRLRSLSAVFALRAASPGGIVTAAELLASVVRNAGAMHGVSIDFECPPQAQRWQVADGMTIAAALLLGEILSNAARHRFGPASPRVSYAEADDGVRIRISNAVAPGAGFGAEWRTGGGVGLELADTMTQMKGGLSLDFIPGNGEVTATITLNEPAVEPAAGAGR